MTRKARKTRKIEHAWTGAFSRSPCLVVIGEDGWAREPGEICPEEGASQDILLELIRLARQESAQGREIARLRAEMETKR